MRACPYCYSIVSGGQVHRFAPCGGCGNLVPLSEDATSSIAEALTTPADDPIVFCTERDPEADQLFLFPNLYQMGPARSPRAS